MPDGTGGAPTSLLQLAEEDRELIRNLTAALGEVADKLHVLEIPASSRE